MARSFITPTITDKGLGVANAWCRAIRVDTLACVEKQYTGSDGKASFTALPDEVDCRIICTWVRDTGEEQKFEMLNEAPPSLTEVSGDLDDISDGDTYKKLSGTKQTKLDGVETGADVTGAHEAATIASQGALATKNTVANAEITDVAASKITEDFVAVNFKFKGERCLFYTPGEVLAGKAYWDGTYMVFEGNGVSVVLKSSTHDVYLVPAALSDSVHVLGLLEPDNHIRPAANLSNGQTAYPWKETVQATATLSETTTPTAVENFGKVYTKNDNKLYFQDGAGVEHEVSLV